MIWTVMMTTRLPSSIDMEAIAASGHVIIFHFLNPLLFFSKTFNWKNIKGVVTTQTYYMTLFYLSLVSSFYSLFSKKG